MSVKAKRKTGYRRWWAFRGFIFALILFSAGIGYLLNRQPESESIIYQHSQPEPQIIGRSLHRHYVDRDGYDYIAPEQPDSINFISVGFWDVSDDGNWLAYSVNEHNNPTLIYLLNLNTGEEERLLDCEVAGISCSILKLNSDGSSLLVRPHPPLNTTDWYLIDTKTRKIETLVIDVPQCFTYFDWLERLNAIYLKSNCWNTNSQIYYFETHEIVSLNQHHVVFSPDQTRYAFTTSFPSYDGKKILDMIDITEWNSDQESELLDIIIGHIDSWHPDSKRLLVSQYIDEDEVGGYRYVLYDTETGQSNILFYDQDHYLHNAVWDRSGTRFVYMRQELLDDNDTHAEIWMYDLTTGENIQIAVKGMYPQWAN